MWLWLWQDAMGMCGRRCERQGRVGGWCGVGSVWRQGCVCVGVRSVKSQLCGV